MQRDFELLRTLLLRVEEGDDGRGQVLENEISDANDPKIYGHLILLDEAGFIEGSKSAAIGDFADYQPQRLTWAGHEFLDSIRDPEIWTQTKEKMAIVSGSTSLEVIKGIAVALAKSALNLP